MNENEKRGCEGGAVEGKRGLPPNVAREKGAAYLLLLLAMLLGWAGAMGAYFVVFRSLDSPYPKELLITYCMLPAAIFIGLLVATLLIRPVYTALGYGQLGQLRELPRTSSVSVPSILVFMYRSLALVTIALAGYCQVIFFVIFVETKF